MRELYLECYSGISGDMSVAALLDAGADKEYLLKTLATMPLTGYEVKITRVKKNGIDSCDFNVVLDSGHENHDHDMEYLYGHLNGEGHTHNLKMYIRILIQHITATGGLKRNIFYYRADTAY